MELGEPWCRRCWMRWSAWFMRAGGRWIDLERRMLLQSRPTDGSWECGCGACEERRRLQKVVDVAEAAAIASLHS
jgi:hypothetical protein